MLFRVAIQDRLDSEWRWHERHQRGRPFETLKEAKRAARQVPYEDGNGVVIQQSADRKFYLPGKEPQTA